MVSRPRSAAPASSAPGHSRGLPDRPSATHVVDEERAPDITCVQELDERQCQAEVEEDHDPRDDGDQDQARIERDEADPGPEVKVFEAASLTFIPGTVRYRAIPKRGRLEERDADDRDDENNRRRGDDCLDERHAEPSAREEEHACKCDEEDERRNGKEERVSVEALLEEVFRERVAQLRLLNRYLNLAI